MRKSLLTLGFVALILIGPSCLYGCGGNGGGENGSNDNSAIEAIGQGFKKLEEGIKNGTIEFIPKSEMDAREKRRVEIRKMQDKYVKEADLMIKADHLMGTAEGVAIGTVVVGGVALGGVVVAGAALTGAVTVGTAGVTVAEVEGGIALTEAGATAVGLGYSGATGYASGGSGTKSALQSGAIEVMFPNAHVLVKAAIDYTVSNGSGKKNVKSSTLDISDNVYNSGAFSASSTTGTTDAMNAGAPHSSFSPSSTTGTTDAMNAVAPHNAFSPSSAIHMKEAINAGATTHRSTSYGGSAYGWGI